MSGEELPAGRMILYADGDVLASFEPGDRISVSAKLKRPDQRYGERYDSYISRGVYLTGNAKSEPERLGGGDNLRTLPLRLNRSLAGKVDEIFPTDTAAFMKSLLLGDKSELYQDLGLYLDLSRAGFLHVVAVSGMHIAFLVGLIQLLFGKSWRSSLLCLALVWFFVLVTGSSPSAVRAAVMQSFLLTAPLVRRENDPLTSLSAALGLILLGNPYAAGSVSLQLSFSAMAGILCLSEPLQNGIASLFPERLALRLRGLISTAASSLAVLAFSVPFMAWHFGSVSLLSPVTNVLGLWAVSLCFCGGYLSCLLGFLFPSLGVWAAWLVSWPVRYLFLLARTVSGVPWAVLYLKKLRYILWIVLVYVLSILCAFWKMKPWKKILLPLVLSAAALASLLLYTRGEYRGDSTISVLDVGQGQCIAMMDGDATLLVDCGGLNSLDNAGETAGAYLISRGRERVDLLVLTHLHADHCNGVPMLLEMLPVRTIFLPAGVEDEDGMLPAIQEAASRHGTELRYLEQDGDYRLGQIRFLLFAPQKEGAVNERCMTGVFSLENYDMLMTADSSKDTERKLLREHPLQNIELLIVGHHGSRYSTGEELLSTIGAKTAVISVGYNTYGHPTKETLDLLKAYGYRVYRTDRDGTVEIRLRN
jgi:competence protein ComEC